MADKIVEIGETDAFVVATQWKMRRAGQGPHLSCSLLELAGMPNLACLRSGLDEALRRHPMIVARVARPWPWTRPWYVKARDAVALVPMVCWRLPGTSTAALAEPMREIASERALVDFLLNEAAEEMENPGFCNIRMDVLACPDGRCVCIMTWSHLVLDGVGAEWLLKEIAALADDPNAESVACSFVTPAKSPHRTLYDRWQATWPMMEHLNGVIAAGIHSLAGRNPRASRLHHDWVHLDAEKSAQITTRAAKICGPLIQTHFFLACAIQAHDAVWRRFRGGQAPCYTMALPIQQRVRGKPAAIFRNNVSVMFFSAQAAEMADQDALTTVLLRQQQQAMKQKLMASFSEMQRWMTLLPTPIYSAFLDLQMKGENTAFHHSNTGSFASGLSEFGGATITNAWHVPGLFSPPGTGLFVSERGSCLTVSVSWRAAAVTADEAHYLRDAFLAAMLGAPMPTD